MKSIKRIRQYIKRQYPGNSREYSGSSKKRELSYDNISLAGNWFRTELNQSRNNSRSNSICSSRTDTMNSNDSGHNSVSSSTSSCFIDHYHYNYPPHQYQYNYRSLNTDENRSTKPNNDRNLQKIISISSSSPSIPYY